MGVRGADPPHRGRAGRPQDHPGVDHRRPSTGGAGLSRGGAGGDVGAHERLRRRGRPRTASSPRPTLLSGQPPVTVGGRPAVVYVGAEFCPYCAAERWVLVVALSRFGTFTHLGATSSSSDEVFPDTATFSFDGATYRSRYVSLSALEEYGDTPSKTAPAGFPRLHRSRRCNRPCASLRHGVGHGAGGRPSLRRRRQPDPRGRRRGGVLARSPERRFDEPDRVGAR